jgi:hypothetical protein
VKRGGQMKGRTKKTDKVESKVLPKRSLPILVVALLVAGSIAAGFLAQKDSHRTISQSITTSKTENSTFKTPQSLAELLALPPTELEHCDIARMNLLCAEGLPGAENLNVNESVAMLDQWAKWIDSETTRNFHHYREDPAYYYHSENFYKMLMMAVVLYDDFHVRYNPKWIETPEAIRPDDGFGTDSRDILIHGLIGDQHMGTCSSMPILYIALARRLGYPVKLVTTRGHLFMRWDSPRERFDMDATGKGLDEYTDEHYKQWPFPVTGEEIKADGYLQSLTPAQELSVFLSIRAECLHQAGRIKETVAALAAAEKLEPNWRANQVLLAEAQQELNNESLAVSQQQALNHDEQVDQMVAQVMADNRARRAQLGIPEQSQIPVPLPDPTPKIPIPR